jgi:gluconate 2-dehydrogenase gamma chain
MRDDAYDRRAFIKMVGVSSMILASGCSSTKGKWRFFTDSEAPVVQAITEQIIPSDDDAGANDANVINYLDKQLMGFFRQYQQTFRRGIAGVQQTSMILFKDKFESLDWSQQTEVLQRLEDGTAEGDIWQTDSAQTFFNLICDHTMQGFYGSPRHGGNRRFVSFKMLDLDYPRIVGQNRYTVFPGTFNPLKK